MDTTERLEALKKASERQSNKIKTIEDYPNMLKGQVLEPRSDLPPEAILVAVGDSHPEKSPKRG